jgi:tRNA-specific 2-thiouridylase
VPDGDHAGFVAASALARGRAAPAAGAIVDERGAIVGRHDGVHRFTIGQHRGLGNLPPQADKLFVTAVDPVSAEVRVGPRASAERRQLTIRDLRWLAPPRSSLAASVQVRHRGAPIAATIAVDDGGAHVTLAEATVAAPGQAAVIYDADRVLAGGWIAR